MSYAGGMGAYYADVPGFDLPIEAVAGFGGCGCSCSGCGCSGCGIGSPDGIGSYQLSAAGLWADVQVLNKYYAQQPPPPELAGTMNELSRRTANRVRAALAQLGFGPDLQMDTPWGSGGDCAAYQLFLQTAGIAAAPGICGGMSSAQLQRLESYIQEQRATGKTPGSLSVKEYHEVSPGNFAEGPAPGEKPIKAGMGLGTIVLLVAAVAGGVVLLARKKITSRKTTYYAPNAKRLSQRQRQLNQIYWKAAGKIIASRRALKRGSRKRAQQLAHDALLYLAGLRDKESVSLRKMAASVYRRAGG